MDYVIGFTAVIHIYAFLFVFFFIYLHVLRAFERFTGPQIAKMASKVDNWNDCERVSLISSFLTSVLLGKYAPIDYADASGTNLFDIWEKRWDSHLLGKSVSINKIRSRFNFKHCVKSFRFLCSKFERKTR